LASPNTFAAVAAEEKKAISDDEGSESDDNTGFSLFD
jgi:hypothetical protein